MSGGGRKGGDSVKWVGKALRAVGAEGVWAHIGVRMRGVTGAVWVVGSVGGGGVADEALRAVGAEGGWAHIGRL